MEFIKKPVRYESLGTIILDSEDNLIADVRGWGRLQYLKNGEDIQNEIGQFIADAINEKLTNNLKMENERLREELRKISKGSPYDALYRENEVLKKDNEELKKEVRKAKDRELDSFISMMSKI